MGSSGPPTTSCTPSAGREEREPWEGCSFKAYDSATRRLRRGGEGEGEDRGSDGASGGSRVPQAPVSSGPLPVVCCGRFGSQIARSEDPGVRLRRRRHATCAHDGEGEGEARRGGRACGRPECRRRPSLTATRPRLRRLDISGNEWKFDGHARYSLDGFAKRSAIAVTAGLGWASACRAPTA
jgi:hypothetical protein